MTKIFRNNKITIIISIIAIANIIKYRRKILNLLTTKLSNFYDYLIKKNFDYITYDNLSTYEDKKQTSYYEDDRQTTYDDDERQTSYYDYNNNDV